MTAWDAFWQIVFSGLAVGAIYAMVALSYNIIFSTTNIINFAQGELLVLGALVGYTLFVAEGIPAVISILFVMIVVAIVALFIELLAVRPVKDVTRNFIWIMSTFGFGIALKNVATRIWGTQPLKYPKLVGGDDPWNVWGIAILPQELLIMCAAVALTVAYEVYTRQTIFGTAIRATAMNRETASLMGINTSRIIYFSYALSGAVAALIGFLIAPITFADPHMGIVFGVKGFIALVLGGLGYAIGGFWAGLFLGLLETFSAAIFAAVWKDAITFLALILVMIFRPSGLFGARS
jgi:branched-chain amino acid transport system permease protein